MLKLVIGNRNYSSWSLRAWWYLKSSGIEFDEIRIPLYTGDWKRRVAAYSPAGRVPVLLDGELAIWDTLAIFEYLRETHPAAVGWPADPAARARARSLSHEMHSGFLALRDELPQNLRARTRVDPARLSADCRAQFARIERMWHECRRNHWSSGPWLFGEFSIADVMYAPVALRLITYSIPVAGRAREFVDAVTADPLIGEWVEKARHETESLPFIDELIRAGDSPLILG